MTNPFDKEYWTRRYLQDEIGWDAGTITAPLKEYADQLKDKNIAILIPGAGNGHEAEYLFNNGFTNIDVIDISAAPLQNIKKRVPDFPEKHLLQNDFFAHEGRYDLIVEQTFFCAIDPSLRKKYAEKMHGLLKPKGQLIGVLFNEPFLNDKPPFGGSKEEYTSYFEKYFDFKTFEPCYNSIKPREGRELFINLVRK